MSWTSNRQKQTRSRPYRRPDPLRCPRRSDRNNERRSEKAEMSEEWRPVRGYEGSYEVSSLGRVRSLPRTVPSRNRSSVTAARLEGKILKPAAKNGGRLSVTLCVRGRRSSRTVAELVAEAFLPNPDGRTYVEYIGENVTDSRPENLRWAVRPATVMPTGGGRPKMNRTHCTRGHELAEPNLVVAALRRGVNQCRSCSRMHSLFGRQPSRPKTERSMQAKADEIYREVMSERESVAA